LLLKELGTSEDERNTTAGSDIVKMGALRDKYCLQKRREKLRFVSVRTMT
jgi:hypothetical protein